MATKLLKALETEAIRNKTATLKADVSKTALPFFLKNKFRLISGNVVRIGDVEVINYEMIKTNIF